MRAGRSRAPWRLKEQSPQHTADFQQPRLVAPPRSVPWETEGFIFIPKSHRNRGVVLGGRGLLRVRQWDTNGEVIEVQQPAGRWESPQAWMQLERRWSMSTAGLAARKACFPAESPFLQGPFCHSMARSKASWSPRQNQALYFAMDPAPVQHSTHVQQVAPANTPAFDKHHASTQRPPPRTCRPAQLTPPGGPGGPPSPAEDDPVVQPFQRLSVYERSSPPQAPGRCSKPLPPLPDREADREVRLLIGWDDGCSLVPGHSPRASAGRGGAAARRSLRVCGLVNPAYLEGPGPQQRRSPPPDHVPPDPPAAPRQRKLRRSHSGPAGSFNKRLAFQPPPPVPPRPIKPADPRRWSAEASSSSSGAYSDEDRPPKVPPREPLSQQDSRTPSPKSLPAYAHGLMPPTQSFAPDPKYVSRGLRRQLSEGSPCILPVLEDGRQASSTHYLLLPPPDWDCPARRRVHMDLV